MDNANKRFRVIPGESVEGFEPWEIPDFDEPERERLRQQEREAEEQARQEELEKRRRQKERRRQAVYERLKHEDEARRALPTDEEIEQIRGEARRGGYREGHREGRHEGYHAGYPEGLKAGEEDGRNAGTQLVQRMRTLLDTLGRPLENLDREIEDELSHLVFTVARRMVLSEMRMDSSHAVAAVNRAMRELPANQRWVSVHVNPDEIGFIEEKLGGDEQRRGWTIVADQQVSHGGCVVQTETSRVDARVERRIDAVAEQLLGEAHTAEEAEEVSHTYRGGTEVRQEIGGSAESKEGEAVSGQSDQPDQSGQDQQGGDQDSQSSSAATADTAAHQQGGSGGDNAAAKPKRDKSTRRRRGTRRKRESSD